MTRQDRPSARGCFGCLFALGLATAAVYSSLWWFGVALPWWVVAADAVGFALAVLALVVLVLARRAGADPSGQEDDRPET
jgi:hypothetical protein